MKILKIFALFMALLVVCALSFIPETVNTAEAYARFTIVPSYVLKLRADMVGYLAAMAPIVTLLTAWANEIFKAGKYFRQINAWIISLILLLTAWALNLSILGDLNWYVVAIYGLIVGLAANGVFNIEVIKTIINLIGLEQYNNTKATPGGETTKHIKNENDWDEYLKTI